ncbi:MAG: HNH endonuclease [Candidatus Atribacteria bacterium]|nr:HNH endonuclease [Candidatus Atribacteria bacterium]
MASWFINKKGYRCFSDSGIPVHRWVARKKVGGSLFKGAVVHHKNRNKLDNRPSNLWVFKNQQSHSKTHRYDFVRNGSW